MKSPNPLPNPVRKAAERRLRKLSDTEARVVARQTAHIVWIPVDESLPDDSTTVLVYSPNSTEPIWLGYLDTASGDWREVSAASYEHPVTHWADLPEPPKA